MSSSELKTCPFCGGKAELIMLSLAQNEHEYYVRCKKKCAEQSKVYSSRRTAITAWNRRKCECMGKSVKTASI